VVLILSNISFQELTEKPDLKEYVINCDYFSFRCCSNKKEILWWMDNWVLWYSLFQTEPLYITVMSDNNWYTMAGTLQNSIHITTWKRMPRYAEDAKNYQLIADGNKIINETNLQVLNQKLKEHNVRKSPFMEVIGK
jgi:hypothetical protein